MRQLDLKRLAHYLALALVGTGAVSVGVMLIVMVVYTIKAIAMGSFPWFGIFMPIMLILLVLLFGVLMLAEWQERENRE